MASTFTSAYATQEAVIDDRSGIDTLTHQTRGRFSEDETQQLLRSLDPIAHPHGRTAEAARRATFEEAGMHHGWPSYRAFATAPTDGQHALAIGWRFTVPHRETVISEVEIMWPHVLGERLTVPGPRPARESIVEGVTYLLVGPEMTSLPMHDGVLIPEQVERFLKPRVYAEGGVELLSDDEIDLLRRVMVALVDADPTVLNEIGAYDHGADPYLWTRDYGRFGVVHLVMPPGELTEWPIDVMQVDDAPGESFLVVGVWTREEGFSDLSLELNLVTDTETGTVRCEFVNLHVM